VQGRHMSAIADVNVDVLKKTVTSGEKTYDVGETFSYGSSMGKWKLLDTPKKGFHIVRLSSSGGFKYALVPKISGKYMLGPDYGHRVMDPSEETDPIKRILRELGIPVSILQLASEPMLRVGSRWYDNAHCPNGRDTNSWIHDGKSSDYESDDLEGAHGHFAGGGNNYYTIEGATYAINIESGRHMGGSTWSKPGSIVVWPSCNSAVLADALAPYIYGGGADFEYIGALKDFGAAQKWVAKHFKITPHPEKGDRVIIDGTTDFIIESDESRNTCVLDRLLRKHGVFLIEEYLSEEQQFFFRAKRDVVEAARYIFAHYRVVAVKRGEEQHLKFAVKSSEELEDIDSLYLGGNEELPLKSLLHMHKALKSILFENAAERMELVPTYHNVSSYKLEEGTWIAEDYNEAQGWHKFPLFKEDEAIVVRLGEGDFSKNLVCLSEVERSQGTGSQGGFHAVMCHGDKAYYHGYDALLPLMIGETRNFIFRISHSWNSPGQGASIWVVTARRNNDGTVVYGKFDNGRQYLCSGYWGGEVSVSVIE